MVLQYCPQLYSCVGLPSQQELMAVELSVLIPQIALAVVLGNTWKKELCSQVELLEDMLFDSRVDGDRGQGSVEAGRQTAGVHVLFYTGSAQSFEAQSICMF